MSEDYEQVCMMCMRPESKAGQMLSLPGNICVCMDCLQKTIDMAGSMNLNPENFNFTSFPGFNMDMFGTFSPNGVKGRDSDSGTENDSLSNFANRDVSLNSGDAGDNASASKRHGSVASDFDNGTGNSTSQGTNGNEPGAAGKTGQDSGLGNGQQTKSDGSDSDGDKSDDNEDKGRYRRSPYPNISFLNLADLQGEFPGRKKIKKSKKPLEPIDLKNVLPPHKIKEKLDEYVIGQEQAKKIISVAVYNHYKRVATGTMDEIEIEKSNILMIGPTGCGKTYLVKTLAKLLDVPLAIADATSLTEAGYIGDDIESVVSKLLAAADNDVERAERGIIFIDEIDKIARKKETTSRDVSGESVQQGMLKLLEGAEVEVPVGANSKNAMVPLATVNTRNILFICGGAFPDLEEIVKQRLNKKTSIGYSAELKDKWDKEKNILKHVKIDDIKKFGMIPEFVGRLPVLCPMEMLDKDMLIEILREPKNAILKQYQKLLELDEVKLEFSDEALAAIAEKAMERDTGARALRAIIEEFMLDIMYEIPKDKNIGKVTITREYIEGTGGPMIEMRTEVPQALKETEAKIEAPAES